MRLLVCCGESARHVFRRPRRVRSEPFVRQIAPKN
jgi:hypothetical protein